MEGMQGEKHAFLDSGSGASQRVTGTRSNLYLLFHSLVTGQNFMVSSSKNLAIIYLKPRNCITKTIQRGKKIQRKKMVEIQLTQ